MIIRSFHLLLLLLLVCWLGQGCRRSEVETSKPAPEPIPTSSDTVVRVHWAGKRELGISANAYYLTRLLELPETKRVEVQFLTRMAVAPWRIKFGEAAVANAPAALFGPLLQDVIKEECYFEIRHGTDESQEMAFAIRLDEKRAGVWRTNLVGVIASLTGIQNMEVNVGEQGWALRQDIEPKLFKLSRVGEWTVVGIGNEEPEPMKEIVARISEFNSPGALSSGNWLEADLDLEHLLGDSFRRRELPGALPRVSLSLNGDGGNVISRGTMTFPGSLEEGLEQWLMPTNLMREPIESFVALRGAGSWLGAWGRWNQLQIGDPPEQLFFWGLEGNPYQTYLAAPLPDAWSGVQQLAVRAVEKWNPVLEQNGYVGFQLLPGTNGALWGNLPEIRPFFTAVANPTFTGVYAGLLPPTGLATNEPVRRELVERFTTSTNLVAYQWEDTGSRIEATVRVGQFARLISRKPTLPLESVSAAWLKGIAPRLAETETMVFLTGTNQLSFERKSTMGLTALELSLLVDWLESPAFPVGLHTTTATVRPVPATQ